MYSGVSSSSPEDSNAALPVTHAAGSTADQGGRAFAPHIYGMMQMGRSWMSGAAGTEAAAGGSQAGATPAAPAAAGALAAVHPRKGGAVQSHTMHAPAVTRGASSVNDPDANFITVFWGGDQTFKIVFPSFWENSNARS